MITSTTQSSGFKTNLHDVKETVITIEGEYVLTVRKHEDSTTIDLKYPDGDNLELERIMAVNG